MTIDKYSLYTHAAGELKTSCDDKIIVDLERLKSITEYDEAINFVTKVFGEVEGHKQFYYPNEVIVAIETEENILRVGAVKKEEQIFGLQWTLEFPDDEEE